ncbi:ricin-type beta-trefoil lectin domain protein [Streptomyces sp. NPDC026673]|uniref:ricin-type beta-trefoil lectin domain protein n=1 Tax=Streptomyces sp. NPDC026673 TaxID=3155724 RepID=UPI00340F0D92
MLTLAGILVTVSLAAFSQTPAAGKNQASPAPSLKSVQAAQALVDARSPELRIGRDDVLSRARVQSGGGGLNYVSYERAYRGLPVVGGDAVVVTDAAGKVVQTATALKSSIRLPTVKARIPAAEAVERARSQVPIVRSSTPPRLKVLSWTKVPRLVWESVVAGQSRDHTPSTLRVFVDAETGAVAGVKSEVASIAAGGAAERPSAPTQRRDVMAATASPEGPSNAAGHGYYNGAVSLSTTSSGDSFQLQDSTRGLNLAKYDNPNFSCGTFTDPVLMSADNIWGNGTGPHVETACVDEQYGAANVYDMLGSWLGRDGFDGFGSGIEAAVGFDRPNASLVGTQPQFGISSDGKRDLTSLDVVGSVYGYGVFATTPGGAGTGNENGGLLVGTGDIFGALTEAYVNNPNDKPDFTVAELDNIDGGGPLRYMHDPSKTGLPNCYSSAIPNASPHTAVGPLDHWFYLVSQGSAPAAGPVSPICAGGPGSVSGQGIKTAGQVFYNALLAKTSTWSYRDVRVATLIAAKSLSPHSCAVYNSVRDAWNAVAVPAQASEPQCAPVGNAFSLSASPIGVNVLRGSSASFAVSTSVLGGTAETVTLSAGNLPAGATASFSPASVKAGESSTMTIKTAATAPEGEYLITVVGSASSLVRASTIDLRLFTANVSTNAPRAFTGQPTAGSSLTAEITTSELAIDKTRDTLRLYTRPLSLGATAAFSPPTVTAGQASTLTVSLPPDFPYRIGSMFVWVYMEKASDPGHEYLVGGIEMKFGSSTAPSPTPTSGPSTTPTPTPSTTQASTGPIRGLGGKCVDVNAASSADGTAVQLYDCNGTAAQNWAVSPDGTLRALGKCMDVQGGATANGSKVQIYTCNGSGAQKWQKSGKLLINPQSGRCLDATDHSSANLTRLQVWDCTGTPNQQWSAAA